MQTTKGVLMNCLNPHKIPLPLGRSFFTLDVEVLFAQSARAAASSKRLSNLRSDQALSPRKYYSVPLPGDIFGNTLPRMELSDPVMFNHYAIFYSYAVHGVLIVAIVHQIYAMMMIGYNNHRAYAFSPDSHSVRVGILHNLDSGQELVVNEYLLEKEDFASCQTRIRLSYSRFSQNFLKLHDNIVVTGYGVAGNGIIVCDWRERCGMVLLLANDYALEVCVWPRVILCQ